MVPGTSLSFDLLLVETKAAGPIYRLLHEPVDLRRTAEFMKSCPPIFSWPSYLLQKFMSLCTFLSSFVSFDRLVYSCFHDHLFRRPH